MRVILLACALCSVACPASAQEEEEETDPASEAPDAEAPDADDQPLVLELAPELPTPTLEGAEPIGSAEPLPEPPAEPQPTILNHIGLGDHPEWEESEDDGEIPHDIAFETPGDPRGTTTTPDRRGAQVYGVDPEEEPPPYVLAAGAGYARFLAATPVDFFRIEERFEVALPELSGIRLGAAASQMFNDQSYVFGAGVRVGMGVNLCDTGHMQCEGVIYVQPGFLAGLTGPRFDLNASLGLRLLLWRLLSVSVDGGYSLLFDGNSLLHVTGSLGVLF